MIARKITGTARAYRLGIVDGWRAPQGLGSGMTWPDGQHDEAYALGVNLGQYLRRGRRSQACREGYPIVPRRRRG